MNWIKSTFIFLIVSMITLEISSFVATKLNLFLVNDTPLLYRTDDDFKHISRGRTNQEKWGAWHVKNSTYRQTKSCFDVLMSFNEVGARDDNFTNVPKESILLLGDSFAEGFGVAKKDSSEYLIEVALGVPVLNFGSSGNFGPLQQLMLYKHYIDIPHEGIIIFILPANDFTDNDSAFWSKIDRKLYRPYFSKKGNPLIPYYFPEATPSGTSRDPLKQFIKDFFWSANAYRTVLMLIRGDTKVINIATTDTKIKSYFYEASNIQQYNLIAAYKAILELANQKEVLFVIIPSEDDISRHQIEKEPNEYKKQSWYQDLLSFDNTFKQKISVLNLMDKLPESTEHLFLDCDGHWSPSGNIWASSLIVHHIKDNDLFSSILSKKD